MLVSFSGKITKVGGIAPLTTDSVIESEPMLFSASPDFAYEKGGSLTRSALDVLWNQQRGLIRPGYHWVIDTRSHMLMPGMIPAIPGWHCDGVIRPKDGNGQPDITKMDRMIRHFTVHVATNEQVSRTEFVEGYMQAEINPNAVWESLDQSIKDACAPGATKSFMTEHSKHGDVVMFAQDVPHRATPSPSRGWRWWFRMSEYDKPALNKIRHQVQVYATEGGGW